MNITLEVRPCLPGYQMLLDNENNAKCICVGARDKSSAVLECDDDNNTIILRVIPTNTSSYLSIYCFIEWLLEWF